MTAAASPLPATRYPLPATHPLPVSLLPSPVSRLPLLHTIEVSDDELRHPADPIFGLAV
jgi:hypothetical protein